MVKPLIPNIEQEQPKLSFSQKMTQKAMNAYAKILGKKKFIKNEIQKHDDQIVTIVQESYEHPHQRKKFIGDWKLDEDLNDIYQVAYTHLKEQKVIISYRGTDFSNIKDLMSDIQIVLGINAIDARVNESLEFFDEVTMKYPHHQKWLCGHSLGGTISYIVTKHRNPERCIVFNPGSAPTKSFLSMMQDTFFKKPRTKKITTYKIFGDPISTLSFIGNVDTLFLKTVDIKKLHSIDSFPALLQQQKKSE